MKPAKAASKDEVPQAGASGAGAKEYRVLGAIDGAFDPAKHTEERLKKQKSATSLFRPGEAASETGTDEPPFDGRVQTCGPLDRSYKPRS